MAEEKTMQEEMNEEWMNLAVSNIHKLLPKHIMDHINAVLPQILNIVKIGIKKNIVVTAKSLGNDKMFIEMNFPHTLKDGSTLIVPTMFKIDKRQIGPSVLNEATGDYEFMLKDGEAPELTFSLLTLVEKIDKYDKMEDLIKDVKNGNFITIKDMHITDYNPKVESPEQKQIETPK